MQEQNVIENMKNIRKNKNSENEIAVTGKSGIFWLKGLAGLLAVMLVFTIASRVVASITVPQVTASAPSSGKIEHTVMASGTVEAGGEKAIVTEEGILVAQVNVHTGESIGEGETLFALDMDSLEDQIYELQNQIKKLQLENDSLKKNKAQADAKQQMELKRAQEDYEETIAKNTVSDGKANEALQKAADAKSQAEKELNSAKDALAQAEKELNAVKEELQNVKDAAAAEQSKDTADQTGEAEKKDTNSTITQKLQQLEEAVQEKQNTYDTIQAKVTEKQAALDSASVALSKTKLRRGEAGTAGIQYKYCRGCKESRRARGRRCRSVCRHRSHAGNQRHFFRAVPETVRKAENPKAAERRDNCTILRDYYKSMCGNRAENNRHGGSCHER